MAASTPLITSISAGLCLAFVLGMLANKIKISPLVGYLIAGIIVGPYTGGFYADPELTHQLAEFGVILLMFGIGLHFSWADLLSVKSVAIPGAIMQMVLSTCLGTILGLLMRWSIIPSIIFGISLATASTVVVLRNLQERRYLDTEKGRIAVGWLVVEDLAMVIVLVLIPSLAIRLCSSDLAKTAAATNNIPIQYLILVTIAKIALFITATLLVGRKVIPWILSITAKTGSRELFRLSILAIALGVAFIASTLFGVSLALGAFFAGMIMSETDMSHKAAEESLPLRDAFAVLFFVSVGMLFNPFTIVHSFFPLILTLLIVMVGNTLIAYGVMRLLRYDYTTSITLACCVSQIGEFAFILADISNSLGVINNLARDLIIGAAIISIILNPLIFMWGNKCKSYMKKQKKNLYEETDIATIEDEIIDSNPLPNLNFSGHTIIVGYGLIGNALYDLLEQTNNAKVIIDDSRKKFNFNQIKDHKTAFICGNAVQNEILEAANVNTAKFLIISMTNVFEAGQIIITAKKENPDIHVISISKDEASTKYLLENGYRMSCLRSSNHTRQTQ